MENTLGREIGKPWRELRSALYPAARSISHSYFLSISLASYNYSSYSGVTTK